MCGPLLVVTAVLFAAGNIPDVDALLIIGDAMFVVALASLGFAWLRDGHGAVADHSDGSMAQTSPSARAHTTE